MLYYGSKLSDNMRLREPEGYLYCLNVPIARTGSQRYFRKELGLDGDGVVEVVRAPEEVFSTAAMASFEGLPVCDDHPFDDVDARNVTAYGKGHVQNVRRGKPPEDDLLFGDLVITHKDLIDQITSGKREISCGYHCNYEEGPDGKIYQRAIRGNHVAVVENGRAGNRVAIRDSAPDHFLERGYPKMEKAKKTPSLFARAVAKFVRDAEPDEGAIAIDEMLENETAEAAPAAAPAPVAQGAAARKDAAAPVPAAVPPVQQPQQDDDPMITDPAATQDEGDPVQTEILAILRELKSALVKPKAEPLDALEQELQGEEKPLDAAEEEMSVDPEQIQDEDEVTETEEEPTTDEDVPEEEKPTTDCGTKDSRAVLLSVLKDLKPVVAALPPAQRKKVSDSMTTAMRKAIGMKASDGKNAQLLARMAGGKKVTKDHAPKQDDFSDYGKRLAEKYNPHFKK